MLGVSRITRNIRNAKRLAIIARVLARHGFGEVVTRLHLLDAIPARLATRLRLVSGMAHAEASRGERLRNVLVELGPTYVKLGQVLSTRPDLIPPDICDDLETLQDHVPPFSSEEAMSMIEEELGQQPSELFGSFEEKPVASASISQVHRATLKDGTAVAVKVQRPGISDVIYADIELLGAVAEWIVEHGIPTPGFDPVGTVDEFSRSIRRELDFSHEARTVKRFAMNFKESSVVRFPCVFDELSKTRVLTMEWVKGTSLRETDKLRAEGHDFVQIAKNGMDVLLRQIFEHGLFHGDPHPGNIFVMENNVLCLLDYGMVGQLTPDDAERFADLLLAIFKQDPIQATTTILDLADGVAHVDRRRLERDMHEFIEFDAEAMMAGLAFGEAMNRAIGILRLHGLALPARFTLLIKALATMEQVGRDLDPDIDLAAAMRPYIERLIKRRYSARRVLGEITRMMREGIGLGRTLPSDMRQLVDAFKRQGFKISFLREDIRRMTESHERAAARITFGMIIAALIVGSSLLMQLSAGPSVWGFPVIGLIGYVISGLMGLGMIFAMWRSRRL